MRLPILFLSLLLSRPPAALPAIMPACGCARAHTALSDFLGRRAQCAEYHLPTRALLARYSGVGTRPAETVPVTQHADPEL